MPQASATDNAEDRRAHNDEQLPSQNNVVGPIEEEKMIVEHLVELPSVRMLDLHGRGNL
ncbi:uncharacterized protein F5147DRAFT_618250 [Suillus discolor]|uniref:Uncharacterized protein n=1 Tax=Suillus discolor TaxID=1912936 RepID=A0A9P7EZU2_9AGAM|nr:uncharacterized protein F5147DRAFT_618250 [Suillus discolor]KAG2097043.1 hypothetical protein F5147DRAFT_618250 [Suillus discolor]